MQSPMCTLSPFSSNSVHNFSSGRGGLQLTRMLSQGQEREGFKKREQREELEGRPQGKETHLVFCLNVEAGGHYYQMKQWYMVRVFIPSKQLQICILQQRGQQSLHFTEQYTEAQKEHPQCSPILEMRDSYIAP